MNEFFILVGIITMIILAIGIAVPIVVVSVQVWRSIYDDIARFRKARRESPQLEKKHGKS